MVLLWVNNHFNDFETNADMCEFLEHFEELLEREVSVTTPPSLNVIIYVTCHAKMDLLRTAPPGWLSGEHVRLMTWCL